MISEALTKEPAHLACHRRSRRAPSARGPGGTKERDTGVGASDLPRSQLQPTSYLSDKRQFQTWNAACPTSARCRRLQGAATIPAQLEGVVVYDSRSSRPSKGNAERATRRGRTRGPWCAAYPPRGSFHAHRLSTRLGTMRAPQGVPAHTARPSWAARCLAIESLEASRVSASWLRLAPDHRHRLGERLPCRVAWRYQGSTRPLYTRIVHRAVSWPTAPRRR